MDLLTHCCAAAPPYCAAVRSMTTPLLFPLYRHITYPLWLFLVVPLFLVFVSYSTFPSTLLFPPFGWPLTQMYINPLYLSSWALSLT